MKESQAAARGSQPATDEGSRFASCRHKCKERRGRIIDTKRRKSNISFAAAVAVIYALAAALWIWLSDRSLLALGLDAVELSRAQSYKGWGFIAVTALILYLLLRAEARHRRRQEAHFQSLIENSSDAIAVLDVTGRITFASPSVERSLGLTPAQMVGRSVREFIHPDDLASGLKALADALAAPGMVHSASYRVRHKDGNWRVHEATVVAPDGTLEVVLSGRDVTERKQREEEIARLAAVVEQAGAAVVITDPGGNITYVNRFFEQVTGYRAHEVLGRNPRILKSGEQDEAFYRNLWVTLVGGGVWQGHVINRRKDGSLYHEDDTIFPIRGGQGEIISYAAVKRDATERIQTEERIRDLNRIYATLSQTNQLLVRVTDQVTLFREICRIAVEYGDVALAWVGLLDGESPEVVPFTHFGTDSAYLEEVRVSTDPSLPEGRGPTGRALREGRVIVDEYTEHDPDRCRSGAYRRGFRAAAAIPLKQGGKVIGSFTLYARKPGFFGGESAALLDEMAADLVFALDHIHGENQRARAEAELRKLSQGLAQSANVVFITDRRGVIEYVNPKFTEITGFTSAQAVGRHARFLTGGPSRPLYREMWKAVDSAEEWHGEVRNRTRGGSLGWCMLSVAPVRSLSGEVTNFIAVAEDISERKQAQALVEHLAFYDPTTELPNRALFADRLSQAIAAARRDRRTVGVMFMDLDRFKQVNDSLGHLAGDRLLSQVGERLKSCVRRDDTVARMGGDEFTVLLPHLARPGDAGLVADKILDAFRQPFRVGGHEVFSSTSIGITLCPDDGEDYETLMRNADAAMYQAKEQGAAYRFFTPEINHTAVRRLQMENALRKALERGEFQVYYQPQVQLATGKVVGAEALVRWRHPERGLVSPGEFIPLAEETGLIVPLGEFVLRQACQDARAWGRVNGGGVRVAVNLSARQFWHGNILTSVRDALAGSGLDPSHLEMEFTESIVMKDPERTIASLRELKALGIAIAIDDFGTGYSSLNYLKRFPIDTLKIDQSFVRDVATDADDAAIVTAIIAMARQLHLHVIAEGVETDEQRKFLLNNGCNQAQGYLFSPPVALQEFLEVLEAGADVKREA